MTKTEQDQRVKIAIESIGNLSAKDWELLAKTDNDIYRWIQRHTNRIYPLSIWQLIKLKFGII